MKRIKLNTYLTQYTTTNSKWSQDLHKKAKTAKFTRNKEGDILINIGFGNNLLF